MKLFQCFSLVSILILLNLNVLSSYGPVVPEPIIPPLPPYPPQPPSIITVAPPYFPPAPWSLIPPYPQPIVTRPPYNTPTPWRPPLVCREQRCFTIRVGYCVLPYYPSSTRYTVSTCSECQRLAFDQGSAAVYDLDTHICELYILGRFNPPALIQSASKMFLQPILSCVDGDYSYAETVLKYPFQRYTLSPTIVVAPCVQERLRISVARFSEVLYSPLCDTDGRFMELQCTPESYFCWCVDRITGIRIPGSERNFLTGISGSASEQYCTVQKTKAAKTVRLRSTK